MVDEMFCILKGGREKKAPSCISQLYQLVPMLLREDDDPFYSAIRLNLKAEKRRKKNKIKFRPCREVTANLCTFCISK